jgi:5'-AMP-activated protein kinase, catalytic alpha subunit
MATKTNIYVVLEYVKGPGRAVQQGSAWKAEGRFCSEVYFQQLISAVDFCHSREVYIIAISSLKIFFLLRVVSDFGFSALPDYCKRQDGLLYACCMWYSCIC